MIAEPAEVGQTFRMNIMSLVPSRVSRITPRGLRGGGPGRAGMRQRLGTGTHKPCMSEVEARRHGRTCPPQLARKRDARQRSAARMPVESSSFVRGLGLVHQALDYNANGNGVGVGCQV